MRSLTCPVDVMAHSSSVHSHGIVVAVSDGAIRLDGQVAAFELVPGLEAMDGVSESAAQLCLTVGEAARVTVVTCPAVRQASCVRGWCLVAVAVLPGHGRRKGVATEWTLQLIDQLLRTAQALLQRLQLALRGVQSRLQPLILTLFGQQLVLGF